MVRYFFPIIGYINLWPIHAIFFYILVWIFILSINLVFNFKKCHAVLTPALNAIKLNFSTHQQLMQNIKLLSIRNNCQDMFVKVEARVLRPSSSVTYRWPRHIPGNACIIVNLGEVLTSHYKGQPCYNWGANIAL